jgi:hypothetical protein
MKLIATAVRFGDAVSIATFLFFVSLDLMKHAVFALLFASSVTAGQPKITDDSLRGAWEFISEETVITEPRAGTSRRATPDWVGMWIFERGYFSCTLMRRDRRLEDFLHPKSPEDLGFEAYAGGYELDKGTLLLYPNYPFHPLGQMPRHEYEIQLNGDTLTLVERWGPILERMTAGTMTVVLKRNH